jgi:TonB family protein
LSSFRSLYPSVRVIAPTILLLVVTAIAVAQSPASPAENPGRDVVMSRIERARALAAAHQLDAAATELESVRAVARDVVERNISTLMLIGIYLEEGNYVRPVALLDEAFQQRGSKKDESIRAYFAVAGQVINGVRMRLARYRSFGINVNATDLPPEALKDIDQIRFLLERLVAQANEATNEKGRAYDAWALKEDVLGLRVSIARDAEDRDKWQSEHAAAREKLASRQIQIASIGRPPALEAVTAKLPNPFTAPKPPGSPEPSSINNDSTTVVSTPETKPAPPSRPPTSNPAASGGADKSSSSSSSPSSQPSDPETVTTGSLSGREIKRVRPQYPHVAKTSGVAGTVRVFVLLDEKGAVTVKGSEGPLLLKQAAEEAARGWSFPPTRINNKPVRLSGYIDFEFKL